MEKIRVLIVDDSVVFRTQIRSALETAGRIEVVSTAANGKIALEKIQSMKVDLVTLDLEMPELNGIDTLKEMRRLGLRTRVIVFSSASKRGAQVTLDALGLGAEDFVAKPGAESPTGDKAQGALETLKTLLIPKILDLFPEKREVEIAPAAPPSNKSTYPWQSFDAKAVVIGCSTGGPTALETIFSQLSGPFRVPIFIAQHMPPIFTASLAARISKICGVPAAEGQHNEIIEPNRIYIAPGNYHMQVVRNGTQLKIQLNQEELENSVRPAVDQLFRTAAQSYHKTCLGIILTGMGQDGLKGCYNLRESRNPIIIQNKESCVVFGMPGAVHQAGVYDDIQDLSQITETLRSMVQMDPQLKRKSG